MISRFVGFWARADLLAEELSCRWLERLHRYMPYRRSAWSWLILLMLWVTMTGIVFWPVSRGMTSSDYFGVIAAKPAPARAATLMFSAIWLVFLGLTLAWLILVVRGKLLGRIMPGFSDDFTVLNVLPWAFILTSIVNSALLTIVLIAQGQWSAYSLHPLHYLSYTCWVFALRRALMEVESNQPTEDAGLNPG